MNASYQQSGRFYGYFKGTTILLLGLLLLFLPLPLESSCPVPTVDTDPQCLSEQLTIHCTKILLESKSEDRTDSQRCELIKCQELSYYNCTAAGQYDPEVFKRIQIVKEQLGCPSKTPSSASRKGTASLFAKVSLRYFYNARGASLVGLGLIIVFYLVMGSFYMKMLAGYN